MCHRVEVKKGRNQTKNFAIVYHIVANSGVRFEDFAYESKDPNDPQSEPSDVMDIECKDYVWSRICDKLHNKYGYTTDQVEILA